MLQIYSLVDESKRKIGYRLKTDIGVLICQYSLSLLVVLITLLGR